MARHRATPGRPASLTEAQFQAVDLLAQGQRAGVVAQAVGVAYVEIVAWQQQPAFVAAVNTQLQDARDSTRQRLRGLADQALEAVEQVITDAAAPPQLRLQAALKVLDLVGMGELAKARIGGVTPDDVEADQRRAEFEKSLY